MPAMALTDLANLFGLVKFYTGRAARASPGLPGRIVGRQPEAPEDVCRLLLLVRNRKGYQQLCELPTVAHLVEGRRDRRKSAANGLPKWAGDGLTSSGGASGRCRRSPAQRQFRPRWRAGQAWEPSFPALLPECSATASRSREISSSRRRTWRATRVFRWSPRIPSSS